VTSHTLYKRKLLTHSDGDSNFFRNVGPYRLNISPRHNPENCNLGFESALNLPRREPSPWNCLGSIPYTSSFVILDTRSQWKWPRTNTDLSQGNDGDQAAFFITFKIQVAVTKTSATCRFGQTLQTREASCLLDSWNSAPLYLRVIRPLVLSEMNETGQEKMVAV
jgi:hypothetical protein